MADGSISQSKRWSDAARKEVVVIKSRPSCSTNLFEGNVEAKVLMTVYAYNVRPMEELV
jgi:hypothetical protein